MPPAVKLRLEVGDIPLDLDEEGSRQNLGALLEPCRSSSLTDTTQAEVSSVSLTLGSSHTTVYPTSMRAPTTPASGLMSPDNLPPRVIQKLFYRRPLVWIHAHHSLNETLKARVEILKIRISSEDWKDGLSPL